MRPIVLNETEKKRLIAKVINSLNKKFADYAFNSSATKIEFTETIGEKLKDKVQIVYSPKAFLRMQGLVDHFDSEVSWFGLVKKKSDLLYYVYDVLVCRQQVDGGKVDTEDEDMLDFISNLTDEQSDNMFFQAHSHVNFSTTASGIDMENQQDILNSKPGHNGFYIFQIWNKKGDINTYLYDLDANRFYDRDDVELLIEDEDYGSLEDFLSDVDTLVEKKKPAVYQSYPKGYYQSYYKDGKYSQYPAYQYNNYLNYIHPVDEDDLTEVDDEFSQKL